jgi:hypothetical protein
MRFLCLALAPLATCSTMAHSANYAGELRPVAGTCDPASQAVLTLRGTAIVFAPAAAQLTLSDANKHPYRLAFQATLAGNDIIGTYSTPRCRYAVKLHLTRD